MIADLDPHERERLLGDSPHHALEVPLACETPIPDDWWFLGHAREELQVAEIPFAPGSIEVLGEYAGKSEPHVQQHVAYLNYALNVLTQGGSALLCCPFGESITVLSSRYPAQLFKNLDESWQRYAQNLAEEGLLLSIPPVLGIVLSRCRRRDAIPWILGDLWAEWANARKKVWILLDALRVSKTLKEVRTSRENSKVLQGSFHLKRRIWKSNQSEYFGKS
jgi:hypothetical protein